MVGGESTEARRLVRGEVKPRRPATHLHFWHAAPPPGHGDGPCDVSLTFADPSVNAPGAPRTPPPPQTFRHVLVCGGLHADRLAVQCGGSPDPAIVPFRGEYLVLKRDRRHLVRGNIYPVPDPRVPFL